uniref:Uncharacterized protein n=1 Tax=Oryza meridionalis TaxID=40149 RepID=A0A0E0CX70_9ORYZ
MEELLRKGEIKLVGPISWRRWRSWRLILSSCSPALGEGRGQARRGRGRRRATREGASSLDPGAGGLLWRPGNLAPPSRAPLFVERPLLRAAADHHRGIMLSLSSFLVRSGMETIHLVELGEDDGWGGASGDEWFSLAKGVAVRGCEVPNPSELQQRWGVWPHQLHQPRHTLRLREQGPGDGRPHAHDTTPTTRRFPFPLLRRSPPPPTHSTVPALPVSPPLPPSPATAASSSRDDLR